MQRAFVFFALQNFLNIAESDKPPLSPFSLCYFVSEYFSASYLLKATKEYLNLLFSKLVSGRNPPNAATWFLPRAEKNEKFYSPA